MKKIVLVTTGQPSTNPRIVKEADALHKAGYEVIVLYCFFIDWAEDADKVLLQKVAWKYRMAGGGPDNKKAVYLFTRTRNKIARILNRYFGNALLLAERTQARAYDELLMEAKKIKADWYIGHNLGALPVVVKAARFHQAKAGFDFEDYHRGENTPNEKGIVKRIVYLENKYLPHLHYFSTASPMITGATKNNHPGFKGAGITLLNCFPLAQQPPFKEKVPGDDRLQLFWFSQTIGLNRGLEVLINALKILNDPAIHLTLAGRCNEDMVQYIKNNAGALIKNIHFAGIIQPAELPAFAAQFDVGMAIELTVPENRNICLTNKIFTYLLAGNAIILSETAMQKIFNETYEIGGTFPVNNREILAQEIHAFKNGETLIQRKLKNYKLAKGILNWEKESEKFILLLNSFNSSGC